MRKRIVAMGLALALVFSLFVFSACQSDAERVTFQINGMVCSSCINDITNAVEAIGARMVRINIGNAMVEFDPDELSEDIIRRTIMAAGNYQVR